MLNKPQNTKYSSHHNIFKPTTFKRKGHLSVGSFGLLCTENGIINAAQIQATSLTIKRKLKQNYNLIVKIFPHIPVSKRPLETPLGKGKASTSY